MDPEDGWSREAEHWIAWARAEGHDAYHLYRDAFFDLVPAGASTLEIGCGEGRVARDLAARGHAVTAVERVPRLLDAAQAADPDGRYVLADAGALPFADGSFDVVVAFNSLMDVHDMPSVVAEASRVLADAGRFCACVVHPMTDAGRFAEPAADAPFVVEGSYLTDDRPWYDGRRVQRAGLEMIFHSRRYPLEAYASALERAGLAIELLREPPVPDAEVARDPAEHRWRRLPSFLMWRAVKLP